MRAYTIFPYDPLRNFETFYIEFDPECKHISLPHDENVEETIFVIEGELTMKLKEEEIQLKKDKRSVFRQYRTHLPKQERSDLQDL